MRNRIPAAATAAASLLVLLLSGCRTTSLADRIESLPALPSDVASTLDPKTQATRIPAPELVPVKDPSIVLAACCSIREEKKLQVQVPLTVCGPLWQFVLAPLSDAVFESARPAGSGTGGAGAGGRAAAGGRDVRMYRHGTIDRARIWDTIVCVTSSGPYNAEFTEIRNCNNYTPQDTLLVTAWSQLFLFTWSGGTANHPSQIQLVSCHDVGTFRARCNDLSSCDCSSSPCPPTQPCECTLQW